MFTYPAAVSTYLNTNRETYPIRLFEIGGVPTLRFTDADIDVTYNSQTWTPKGITYSKAKLNKNFEVQSYDIGLDNIDDFLISWYLANDPTGYDVTVYKGFAAEPVSEPISLVGSWAGILFKGRITRIEADEEFVITAKSAIDFHRQRGPRVMQHTLCRFQGPNGFKGVNCGYVGAETECNFTFARCNELENQERFGGYPDLNSRNDR